MKELPTDLQLKIMSNADPESFSVMMATCNTFFTAYLPISRIIRGLASYDQAININTLHHLINNMSIYHGHFPKILSLIGSFSKRESTSKNLNILILLDMLRFLLHLDMQPEKAQLDCIRIANNISHKLYNGLVLDLIMHKCFSLKNMPNKLSTIINNIQGSILTVDSRNDNAGFCNQDSILFYTGLFYLDINAHSKSVLMSKILKWLSIQERSTNYDLNTFEVMAANMRCLGYKFDSESRAQFSTEIIRNSRCLSLSNFSRRGGPTCLEDDIAYSIIRIDSINLLSEQINAFKIKVFYPFGFLEKLLKMSCSSYVSYLLIQCGKYFIDYLFDSVSCVNAARNFLSIVNNLSNSKEVKESLVSCINAVQVKDVDINKYLALYILKFNFGVDYDYTQLSVKLKEMIINEIKIDRLETRWILKDVFSEEQCLEIECIGLEYYVKYTDKINRDDFLSYLLSSSVSEVNREKARQLVEKNNLLKLPAYPKSLYGISSHFKHLQFQDEDTKQAYINHAVAQMKMYLNPEYKSDKNINEAYLSDVFWALKHRNCHHLIKSEFQEALIDTINHLLSLDEIEKPYDLTKISKIYRILEKFIEYFNEDSEIIITKFLFEIIALIFKFNLSDEPLYSDRYYPNNIIRLLLLHYTHSVHRVIDECWLPFLVEYRPGQLGKVISQISINIKNISDELFRKQLIAPLFKILGCTFKSDDYIANDTYQNQMLEIYKCLSYKCHLLTYDEICLAGSRSSQYQCYFTFIRASMEIGNTINVICER